MGPFVFHGLSRFRMLDLMALANDLKALDEEDNLIGVIVCKLEPHRGGPMRGYIAMLATRKDYRGYGIATSLVKTAVEKMIAEDADEVTTSQALMYLFAC